MPDLDIIFGTSDQLLPQTGLIGFLIENWIAVAIAVMLIGFAIDQILYVVRYRPQEKWIRWYNLLIQRITGKNADVSENRKNEPEESAEEDPLQNTGMTQRIGEEPDVFKPVPKKPDAPVIRRGGARYAPKPVQPKATEIENHEIDADAPLVVRVGAPVKKNTSAEPATRKHSQQ